MLHLPQTSFQTVAPTKNEFSNHCTFQERIVKEAHAVAPPGNEFSRNATSVASSGVKARLIKLTKIESTNIKLKNIELTKTTASRLPGERCQEKHPSAFRRLHYRANMAHIRQSRPESGLGSQIILRILRILGDI